MAVEYKVLVTVGAIAAVCTAIGVLAVTFSTYFLVGFGLIAFALVWRFAIAPSKESHARTALILAEAYAKETEADLQRQEREAKLRQLPAAYEVMPDGNGNYPAFIDPQDSRIVAYIAPGNSPVRSAKQLPPPGYRSVEEDTPLQIEAPKHHYKLSQQMKSGETAPYEVEPIIGYDRSSGAQLRGSLFAYNRNIMDSFIALGEQGFGKSAYVVYIAALCVLAGGNLLVIDPDEGEEDCITSQLGPLTEFLLLPVAKTPEEAERILDLAEAEIDAPSTDKPLFWIVDEFGKMSRSLELKGKWAEVATRVLYLAEEWGTSGRKRLRKLALIGQQPQATRTGGTELRDVLTALCFHLKKKKAQMILEDGELATLAATLGLGELICLPAGSKGKVFDMAFPEPDLEGLEMVVQARRIDEEPTYAEPVEEPARNATIRGALQLIRRYQAEGKSQTWIIEKLYGVSKGGSQAYEDARKEYQRLVRIIALEDAGMIEEARKLIG